MIRFLTFIFAVVAMVPLRGAAQDVASDAEPLARSAVLELAGAFSNDGYKIRDGFYFGTLNPDQGVVIEVNLFAGNEYWFCAAASPPARTIDIKVYEDGMPVEQQVYQDGMNAASGVTAKRSGKYFVKILLTGGEKASPFCFLYCYK